MIKNLLKSLKFLPLHILLWVFVWLFFVYFFSYASENKDFVFLFSTSLLPITMAATYVFSFILIPKYLLTKKNIAFALYALATIICSIYAVLMVTFIIFVFLSDFNINQMPLLTRNIAFVLILVYLVVGLVSFIQVLHYNYKTINRNSELENKLLEGKLLLKQKELHYLKQQIHPHFLFNTLNTMYGFALKESKETPELILKLSNLLDYILNQIDKPSVPLSEEIKYIESFIGLEEIRFRDSLKVIFKKNVLTEIQLPPMLFMAFVENAFKHGAKVDGFLHIEINLNTTQNSLLFQVKNTIDVHKIKAESHGLGLQNSKKRLDVLYSNKYQLEAVTENNWHILRLAINFSEDENV